MNMKETSRLEFKESVSNTFLKTVSAYANYNGGVILFGVSDEGEEVGLTNPQKSCLDIENKINDSISPKPDYRLNVRANKVVTLEVFEGNYKPYLYKAKAYKRNDTSTIELDQIELRRFLLESANMYFEELPCGKDNLSFDILEEQLKKHLSIKRITDDSLRTLGFYDKNHKFNNAAALLSDDNDFYGVDIAKFGKNINEIYERVSITNVSLITQFEGAVLVYCKYYKYELIEGFERKTVHRVPEEAFREALANALIHRNWDIRANVKISMYDDKIVIDSPGGLPNGLTKEDYLLGTVSAIRNPIIANIFFRLGYIEKFGTGIMRIKNAYAKYLPKPEFVINEESVRVVLPVCTNDEKLTPDEREIIELLKIQGELTSTEIATITGKSKSSVLRNLKSLMEKNFVVSVGVSRATRYRAAL